MISIYDNTEIYDLFESDTRREAVRRHWEKLLAGKNVKSFLDVSVGTGNLTLPLTDLGVEVYGSDLSESMLAKCHKKAAEMGKKIDLRKCDFRSLTQSFDGQFDCVASTGNSLPHVRNEDVLAALSEMDALVRPNGYIYFDTRNWDEILEKHERFYCYNPTFIGDTRVNSMQVWDYNPDGSMTFNLLYTFEKEGRIVSKERFEETYYPVARKLLLDHLEKMGYRDITVHGFPAHLDWQDVETAHWCCVMARKA